MDHGSWDQPHGSLWSYANPAHYVANPRMIILFVSITIAMGIGAPIPHESGIFNVCSEVFEGKCSSGVGFYYQVIKRLFLKAFPECDLR